MPTKTLAKGAGMILLVIAMAQFIITIDSTFMNVSISTLVKDLHTTVTGIQSAITFYTLTMAALMIAGAKIGDIFGRKKIFILGAIIYGLGTLIASLSSDLTMFMIGWSFIEAIGAALMIPAMVSLIAGNFAIGPPRAKAYALFASVAAMGAALGPIIGGFFTTYLSWRLAFGSELLVVFFILWKQRIVKDAPVGENEKTSFDWPGFILSAAALAITVQGIILASTYGLIRARQDYVLFGKTITQTGQISPTIIFVTIGILIGLIFAAVQWYKIRHGKDVLLDIRIFKNRTVTAGSITQMLQNLVLAGFIFALSLYVQIELGYSAMKSGLVLMPLSLSLLVVAMLSSKMLSDKFSPKRIVIAGFCFMITSSIVMGISATKATSGLDFAPGLILAGIGIGCIVSQLQNFVISSVKPSLSSQTSGTLATAQNVGMSLGTSIAGAVILAILITTATTSISNTTTLTYSQQTKINSAITQKAQVASNAQVEAATADQPENVQTAVFQANEIARQKALGRVYYVLGAVGLVGFVSALMLPKSKPLGLSNSVI